jgi:hypothetical protein
VLVKQESWLDFENCLLILGFAEREKPHALTKNSVTLSLSFFFSHSGEQEIFLPEM